LALHAVVRLDPVRREAVERLLLGRLLEEGMPDEQRADIALMMAALGDLSPRTAATAGRALARAMAQTNAYDDLQQLARGLAAVAARMGPVEGARTLTRAMGTTTDPFAREELARGLAAVAARLGPEEAARHCAPAARALTKALGKPTNFVEELLLARGLAAVA